MIANVATQENFGYDGKLYASYDAIQQDLYQVFEYAYMKEYSIALPKIGCGLAGGDWSKVKVIIEDLSHQFPAVGVEVYSLKDDF